MTETQKVKSKIYKRSIFLYGFITLTYTMAKFEAAGEYEECQLILDAIRAANEDLGMDLPTTYDSAAWNYFLESMQGFKMNGENAAANIPHYAELIQQEIFDKMPVPLF